MRALFAIASILFTLSANSQTHSVTNTNDSGPGSLRAQIAACQENDTVNFSPSLFGSGNTTIILQSEIVITTSICIEGAFSGSDTIFLSGGNTSEILKYDYNGATKTAYLNNLAFIRANGTYIGGAVYCDGPSYLEVRGCVFKNNRSWFGSGIRMEYGDLKVWNSIFSSNQTTNSGSNCQGSGSAISVSNGDLELTNVKFSGNSGCADGSTVHVPFGGIQATDCLFIRNASTNNVSPLGGGAVRVAGNSTFTRCTFQNNTSVGNGGAVVIYNYVPLVTFQNCLFKGNSVSNGQGGAIYGYNGQNVIITNCTFRNNTTQFASNPSYYGGAIMMYQTNLEIKNSTFSENTSPVIYQNGSSSLGATTSKISNSTIVNTTGSSQPLVYAGSSTTGTVKSTIASAPSGPSLNTQYTSLGYNIFGNTPSFSVSSDQVNKTPTDLNVLGYQQVPGIYTPVLLMQGTSIAINTGTPTDYTNAQNGPIFGRRDCGASEYFIERQITASACNSYTFNGITYTSSGIYNDTLRNANTIDSIIELTLSITSIDTTLTVGYNYLVANEQTPGATYQWYDCDSGFVMISGATDSILPLPSNGFSGYRSVVISLNGCQDTVQCKWISTVSVDEDEVDKVLIYPNPASNSFYIDSEIEPLAIKIFSTTGLLILQSEEANSPIDISDIPSGLYLIEIKFEGENSVIKRIVIQ